MNGTDMDVIRKQLLLNISEILEQKGLISDDEKKRMRNIVNEQSKNRC